MRYSTPVADSLKSAIDPRPLTIDIEMGLAEAIAILGHVYSSCVLPSLDPGFDSTLKSQVRASCLLVMADTRPIGILTERAALKAIVTGCDLAKLTVSEVMEPLPIVLNHSEVPDIFTGLSLLRQHQIPYLPLMRELGQPVEMLTLEGIRQSLRLDDWLKAQPLSAVSLSFPVQESAGKSVLSLAQCLVNQQVDTLLLTYPGTDQREQPAGILTAQNIIQLYALGVNLAQMQADALMPQPLLSLSHMDSILAACVQMKQQRVQQVLVTAETGQVVGLVTPTCFLETFAVETLRSASEELQRSIQQFALSTVGSATQIHSQEDGSPEDPQALRQQLECNRILNAMALRIRESLDLNETLNTTVEEVRQFLNADRVLIYRFNPDMSGTIVVESVASGWTPAFNSRIKDTCFGQYYADRYRNGRMQVVSDIYAANLSQCHIDILALYDVRASLVLSILQEDQLWGLLCAYQCSQPRHWQPFEVDLLQQLSTHISIAIQQSELHHRIQTDLIEKEVLLREIHHRVKNNLQTISSLLRLQSAYIQDQQTVALFQESQNRIRTMALIHEKLYQAKNFTKINLEDYICELTTSLLRSYSGSSQAINLVINVSNIWVSVDTAIPCGLLINELMTNSLKHAFAPGSQDNKIQVEMHSIANNYYVLSISDNGVGFPRDLDFQNTESLGLDLVCTFVEQLGGTIDLLHQTGTSFIIKFKELREDSKKK